MIPLDVVGSAHSRDIEVEDGELANVMFGAEGAVCVCVCVCVHACWCAYVCEAYYLYCIVCMG